MIYALKAPKGVTSTQLVSLHLGDYISTTALPRRRAKSHAADTSPDSAAWAPHGHCLFRDVSGIVECSGKGFLVLHGNFGVIRYREETESGMESFDFWLMNSAPLKKRTFRREHAKQKSR